MFLRAGSIFLIVASAAGSGPAAAQSGIRPSQHGTLTQRVGYTDIAIAYNRPVARGRTLFGEVVSWGRIWTPGADSATMIDFNRDVEVEGHALTAGSYSLWMIPHA